MVIHGEVVGEDRLRWSLEYRAMMCVGWCVCVCVGVLQGVVNGRGQWLLRWGAVGGGVDDLIWGLAALWLDWSKGSIQ